MLFTIDQLAVNNFRTLDPEITLLRSVAVTRQVASFKNRLNTSERYLCLRKVARSVRRLRIVPGQDLDGLALHSAELTCLTNSVALKRTHTRETSRSMLRNKVSVWSHWHNARITGAAGQGNIRQPQNSFHLFSN
jgi:hypothetical protein